MTGDQPDRAAASPTCIAQHQPREAAAAEDPSIRERDPVAARLRLQIDETQVQGTCRVGAERRGSIESVVGEQHVLATVRTGSGGFAIRSFGTRI